MPTVLNQTMAQTGKQSVETKPAMDLSIISVNWNSVDYLRDCIASVYEHTNGISFEFIVVDNNSPQGGVDSLKNEFPEIVLIKSDKNLGFAGANNLGFRRSSGKSVLFLNPDTKLTGPAINTILRSQKQLSDAGVVGCKLLNGDLTLQTSSILAFPTVFNQLFQMEYLRLRWPDFWGIAPMFTNDSKPAPVEAVSGACMMMDRKVFEQVGMFSEDYFMYAEDLDLCYKVKHAGYKNYFVSDATIIHLAGKSSAPDWQIAMKLKAELLFCLKNRGILYAWFFKSSLACNAILRLAILRTVSLMERSEVRRNALEESISRWRLILKTLLTKTEPQTGNSMGGTAGPA